MIKGKYLVGIYILGLVFFTIVWTKQPETTETDNKSQTGIIVNRDNINEAGKTVLKANKEIKPLPTSVTEMNDPDDGVKVDEDLPVNKSTFLSEYYNEDAVALMEDNLDVNLIENILKRQDSNDLSITKETEILEVLYDYENEGVVSVDSHYCSSLGCVIVYQIFIDPNTSTTQQELPANDGLLDEEYILHDKVFPTKFVWDLDKSIRKILRYDAKSTFGEIIDNSQTNVLLVPFVTE